MERKIKKMSFKGYVQDMLGRVFPMASKDLFSNFLHALPSQDESLASLSQARGVERRTSIRVRYPEAGFLGKLPLAKINGEEFRARDISLGGICLYDPKLTLGTEIGGNLTVVFDCEEASLSVSATIMGITMEHCHLKFTDANLHFNQTVEKLLAPGYLGQKFFRVGSFDALKRSEVREIWVTTTGDNFVVYNDGQSLGLLAEFTCFGITTQIFESKPPRLKYLDGSFEAKANLTVSTINDHIICLANFRSPSPFVKRILAILQCCITTEQKAS